MTIKEMEARTGLTRANIRFYEAEGLITPERRPNGYRDYSEEDLTVLQRVKLLRSLHMSLEEIKAVRTGDHTLAQALDQHLAKLERDQACLAPAISWLGARLFIYSLTSIKVNILHPFCMLFQHRIGINFTLRNRPNQILSTSHCTTIHNTKTIKGLVLLHSFLCIFEFSPTIKVSKTQIFKSQFHSPFMAYNVP